MNKNARFRKHARDYAFRVLRTRANLAEHFARMAEEARNGAANRCAPAYYEAQASAQCETAQRVAVEYSEFIRRGSYV